MSEKTEGGQQDGQQRFKESKAEFGHGIKFKENIDAALRAFNLENSASDYYGAGSKEEKGKALRLFEVLQVASEAVVELANRVAEAQAAASFLCPYRDENNRERGERPGYHEQFAKIALLYAALEAAMSLYRKAYKEIFEMGILSNPALGVPITKSAPHPQEISNFILIRESEIKQAEIEKMKKHGDKRSPGRKL